MESEGKLEFSMQGNENADRGQATSHTFIARFWLERREIKDAKPIWRGVVEHVISGERRYLEDLDEIKTFITCYLQETDIWPHENEYRVE